MVLCPPPVGLVRARLRGRFGVPPRRRAAPPFEELVQTILSQNTTDLNSARTFASLTTRFPRWEKMASARPAAIANAIRAGGLADVKARYLREVTREVLARRGDLDLSFLRKMNREAALAWLESLPGVGAKTARVVLLFACGKEVFPVDTHILRVTKRLGYLDPRQGAAAAHRFWDEHCPRGAARELHINLIRHGRETCRSRRPACGACSLADVCPSAS